MPDSFEKTEAPTPRRRSEAREEGNVAKSQDLNAAIMLLGAVLLLGWFGHDMLAAMRVLVASMLGGEWTADASEAGNLAQAGAVALDLGIRVVIPVVLGMIVLGVTANLVQIGVLFSMKPLTPNFNKLSPIRGLKNIFSMRGVMRLAMSLLKVFVVVAVATIVIRLDLPKVLSLIRLETGPLLVAAAGLVWSLALKIAVVLLILAILDFAYQRWQHEQDLKMSKEEVKEEMKRMEGDPLVKQRRAKVARQLTLQRINSAVPRADVVVTNPTHFAVALKYDDTMAAPKVVAKGADYMALRIRQIAVRHGIPIVERPPLARALYKTVEVGQEIPVQFYSAVAEILAYVYRLSGRKIAQPA